MTSRARTVAWVALLWGLTGVAAWVWGAAGRFQAERAARDAEQALRLADARGAILEAELALQATNFGEARAALDRARDRLERARPRFGDLRDAEASAALERAIDLVGKAREAADALSRTAQDLARAARLALDEIPRRRPG